MKVVVGIATWNEEASIGLTIDSLFQQTLFTRDEISSIGVCVVANGCSDQSVPRAQASIDRNLSKLADQKAFGRVLEIARPSKSNAWNVFVHDFVEEDVDYVFMMDADVIIKNEDSMWKMVCSLHANPRAHAASALGVKDIELKRSKTILDRISIGMTNLERSARLMYICGQLYCGRTSFLKNWQFPEGWVAGDDGWLATMAITNFLTTEDQFDRIVYPEGAEFVFEAYTSIPKLFKQHRRRYIGGIVRGIVADFVKSNQNSGLPDAGTIVRKANNETPDWLKQLTESLIVNKGFWVIPLSAATYRFTQLRNKPLVYKLMKLPLATIGAIWQIAVIFSANRMFQRRTFLKAWHSNPNARLVERTGTSAQSLHKSRAGDERIG